jgi:hypothetical protein
MTEREFAEMIAEAVEAHQKEWGDLAGQVSASSSFSDRGLLTCDEGVVIRLEDGSEFQVTVVQSRRPVGD